jgi:hypothetical protein
MSISATLTDRAAGFLGRRSSRRSFLSRTAVVGSALTVAGGSYVLRPGTAYAAVCTCLGRRCDCSNLCCDGYTEFCCAIYGQNSCPPNTLLAGWWKVDNSHFCNGAARYYMDCNKRSPNCGCGSAGVCRGSDTVCQCRSCNYRKDGCTAFRYGNCNNHVSCVGPIMCRVVTCTRPWEIDPGCSTVPRTDNNTRYHHRSCLDPPPEPTAEQLAWARAIFNDYLGRPGSASDHYNLASHVARGRSRQSVSLDVARSTEYIHRYLNDLYQSVFGRNVDETGRRYWTARIKGGLLPAHVAAGLYGSLEFFQDSGSVERFVERLYEEILGREADEGGKQFWIGRYEAGWSRKTIAGEFYGSKESRQTRVIGMYQRFLQRQPDPGGLASWTRALGRGDDLRLASFLSGSTEYFRRARQRFPS